MNLLCNTLVNALGVPFNALVRRLLNCCNVLVTDWPELVMTSAATRPFMRTLADLAQDIPDTCSARPDSSTREMSTLDELKAVEGRPLASLSAVITMYLSVL